MTVICPVVCACGPEDCDQTGEYADGCVTGCPACTTGCPYEDCPHLGLPDLQRIAAHRPRALWSPLDLFPYLGALGFGYVQDGPAINWTTPSNAVRVVYSGGYVHVIRPGRVRRNVAISTGDDLFPKFATALCMAGVPARNPAPAVTEGA